MRTQFRKIFTVGVLWAGTLLFLAFFYPDIADYALRTAPYSFVLLTPFGFASFFGWVLALTIYFGAAHVLGWTASTLLRAMKWLVVLIFGFLLMHAAWVVFVIASGGL